MTPDVTVVVCTRDRPRELERCLASLSAQRYPQFEILVVDNGATDGIADLCRVRGVACIREPQPGLTRARNLAARAARGDIVAYIDDDAVAEPDWLAALVRPFADRCVAAVAGHTRYMKSRRDSLEMTPEDAPHEGRRRAPLVVDLETPGWFTTACFGGIGDGNTMAFRRHLLTSAVRFDERIGRGRLIDGGDEHVAFMSLISDGYRVVHVPEAVVRHPAPATESFQRAKRVRDLRSSIAYLLFVTNQFPTYRREIARFVGKALLKKTRRLGVAKQRPGLSPYELVSAIAGGCRLYWRARQEWASPVLAAEPASPRVVTLR
jgi:glycosyltransferase involved in cell wall biosynthesis